MAQHKKRPLKKILGITITVILVCSYWLFYRHQERQAQATSNTVTITNVSYDPTREFYLQFDKAFQKYWQAKTGQKVNVDLSNGGSGKQANSVIEGNQADVVTLALDPDITSIQNAGLIQAGWQKKFPDNAAPYTSTIVLLVRKDNPKNIKDWDDLVRPGMQVISPNPKTSGGARWNYLAAWAYADKKFHHDTTQIKQFMKQLYQNVTVLDSGTRDATTTFVQNKQGDVLVAWENEALLTLKQHPGQYQIVTPSISMKAEPSVAVVDKTVDQRGTRKVATGYINYLYTKTGQRLAAENFYRPTDPAIAKDFQKQFPKLNLITINDPLFGGWAKTTAKHFADGGTFDQIYHK